MIWQGHLLSWYGCLSGNDYLGLRESGHQRSRIFVFPFTTRAAKEQAKGGQSQAYGNSHGEVV